MKATVRHILKILALTLLPTFLIWIPFVFNMKSVWGIPLPQQGMGTIVSNFDGPLYIAISKSMYNFEIIRHNYSFPLPLEYYPAHFPLFPILIRMLAPVLGSPYSMLTFSLVGSFLAIFFFHKIAGEFVSKKNVNWITFIFSIFPARWLIVRSVGSPEPLFLAATLASLYYFYKKKYLPAGIWGGIAQLVKPPGILLFVAYILFMVFPTFKNLGTETFPRWIKSLRISEKLPILLIPTALLMVFVFYSQTVGDFFAYFKTGDNIHVFFPPFQIFNYNQTWVRTFWLEEIIFVYLFSFWGLIKLFEKKNTLFAYYVGVFFFLILFVSHRDLIRYSLPMIPLLIIGYSDILTRREFKWAMWLILVPIYLYSISYVSQNTMPISDWAPLL